MLFRMIPWITLCMPRTISKKKSEKCRGFLRIKAARVLSRLPEVDALVVQCSLTRLNL
ncbi:MAG: hypothetical protein QN229_00790 [Desulfurococcaceae archaeon TW002]